MADLEARSSGAVAHLSASTPAPPPGAPGTAPPGAPPPPGGPWTPAPQPPGRPRSPLPFILAGAGVVIVILVVVLVIVLVGGDGDESKSESTTSPSAGSSNEPAAERQLRRRVDSHQVESCKPGTAEKSPGEKASLDCKPLIPPGGTAASVPNGVSYYLFGSPESMNAAYNVVLENNSIALDSGGLCKDGVAGEGAYAKGGVQAGRAMCFVDEEGDAVLWWTEPSRSVLSNDILAVAYLRGGDIGALDTWWKDHLP